jgi:hypothetical protein
MTPVRLSPYHRASLRIAAFAALKGWGEMQGGQWRPWNWAELSAHADELVSWALDGKPIEGDGQGPPT